jgi:chromosome segregation ATPase
MRTETATLVSWKHSETKDGHLHFDIKLLAANPELMRMYVELRNRYEDVAIESEAKRIADLEAKSDLLVLEYRRARTEHVKVKDEKFSILQRHATAHNAVRQASARYDSLQSSIESSSGEFETRAELANKQTQLVKLKQDLDAAVLVESGVVSELQRCEYGLVDAAEKANKAAVAVANCKRELEAARGNKGGHDATTGLSMG